MPWLLGWMRRLALPGVALWVCAAMPAWAVGAPEAAPEAQPEPPPAVQAQPDAQPEVLEATRRSARSVAEWLARSVDSWFGKRPFAEGGKVSDGRLSLGVFKRQDQATDVDLRFKARFRLPNVQDHAYLFVGRDDEREVVRDTPDTVSRQQQLLPVRQTDRSFIGGLGLTVLDAVDFRLGLGSALRPYAQARVDLPWEPAPGHRVGLRETVFWTAADRLGSTTVLSYDLEATPTMALHWLYAVTITQVSRNVEWSSSLGLVQSLGGQRQVSLEAVFNGTGTRGAGVGLSDRGLLAKWVQPVHQDWLLAEVVVGHFWPRPDASSQRGRAWALGGSLNLLF